MDKTDLIRFHAYIIEHANPQTRLETIKEMLVKNAVHATDVLWLNAEDSISIAEVKKVVGFTSFKPLNSTIKAVVIAGDKLTLEAQQALLKTLEEPGPTTILVIETASADALLSTIVSRCLVMHPKSPDDENTSAAHHKEFWQSVFAKKPGARLKEIATLPTDREEISVWILSQIHFFRAQLIEMGLKNKSDFPLALNQYRHVLNKLLDTHLYMRQNIAVRLALDSLFLDLPICTD